MISQKMQDAMNEQIKNEFYSAYLYLAMAAYFSDQGLDGMAQWMRVQVIEEQLHAMKFFDHINDREGRVDLQALDKPPAQWSSPLDAWKATYEHEKFVTGKINDLVTLARELNDNAAMPMLNWFVEEQIEEEATAAKQVQTMEMIGDKGPGLVMFDRELASRTFTWPPKGEKGE